MIVRKSILALCLSAALSTPGMVLAEGAPTDSAAYKAAAESRTPEDPSLVWTASHVALLTEEIAPGVHAVYPDTAQEKNDAGAPEATSGGFVIGKDGVLVVDTMLNRRLA